MDINQVSDRSAHDREFEVIRIIASELADLDDATRNRVVTWINQRFGYSAPTSFKASASPSSGPEAPDFASLFYEASPQGEAERALLASFWVQEVMGLNPFDSKVVNDQLKQLGYPVSNITRSLGDLGSDTPRLVVQVHKSGSSQQARKRYRVTYEGIRAVTAMRNRTATP